MGKAKSYSKSILMKICSGLGMEFDGIRKTLPDGKRMFIVRRGNESFGFPTLSTLKYWLESNMNVQHSTMINLLHKNPK